MQARSRPSQRHMHVRADTRIDSIPLCSCVRSAEGTVAPYQLGHTHAPAEWSLPKCISEVSRHGCCSQRRQDGQASRVDHCTSIPTWISRREDLTWEDRGRSRMTQKKPKKRSSNSCCDTLLFARTAETRQRLRAVQEDRHLLWSCVSYNPLPSQSRPCAEQP